MIAQPSPVPKRLNTPVSRRIVLLVLVLLALVPAVVVQARQAWHQAWLKEAYLSELEAAARQRPADGTLLALLGARYAEATEYSSAAAILERAVGAGMTEPAVFLTWAASHAANGQPDKAEQVLKFAVGSGKCQPSGPARAALSALTGLLEQASAGKREPPSPLELARAISPEGPGKLAAQVAGTSPLQGIYDGYARRDPERSGFDLRRRDAAANPEDRAAQIRWVEALRRNRRVTEAEAVARTALEKWPDSRELRLAYADVLYQGGAVATAGMQYRQLLEKSPENTAALLGLGRVALDKQLFHLAISSFERATQLLPNDPEVWIGLGRAYLAENHRFDKSEEAFQKAAQLAPDRTDFYGYWSDTKRAITRNDEAESLLRKRLAAAPEDARTHYLLGKLLLENRATPEGLAEAEKLLRRSLEIEPNAPVVKVLLAQRLLDKGDAESAADAGILLVEALEADPRDAAAYRLLARAYQRIGRKDRVEETSKLAVKWAVYANRVMELEDRQRRNPRDIGPHRELAKLYAEGGEVEKAKREEEMVYMLTHHREAAERGLTTLMEAASRLRPDDAARGTDPRDGSPLTAPTPGPGKP
jgi:predicted Zn-dependent protease